ncbi:MAG TPA: Ig-like domain-containing protein, partial [Vicinamibacterales bacterium]|nr:Ig-like domain-containing protein [Vicinamibacterales bacterium]
MSEPCERSITFTIPDPLDGPGIRVTVVEKDGKLIFTVLTEETSTKALDLRGLFFHIDESALPGLTVTNADPIITDTQIAQNSVLDLGQGANMNGAVKDGFDVGIRFGTPGIGKDDVDGPVSFTLEGTSDLTLDDIAHMQFGARTTSTGTKVTTIAPAAPDAVDDAYSIFEDGQSGLDDPSTVPEGVLFEVLANDTDADGDTLTITDVFGALNGTVQIVDGADADDLPGDAVLYTPFEDFAGIDSFTYCISDNNGGTDFAMVDVDITAVADVPDIDVQVLAGNLVNEIRLIVTATQTDADSSEYIDRVLTSDLPLGVTIAPVTVNPGTEPDQIIEEYLLTLPLDQDADFDLTFTAVSKETSNGDEETGSETIDIVYEYNTTTTPTEFTAENQSIWSTGDEFVFVDDRFVGVDTGPFNKSTGSTLFAGIEGDIRIGFESTLTFEGGEIDATANYDVTVETN